MDVKLTLPLFCMVPRKTVPDRKVILNLNNYRNLDKYLNNDAKVVYKALVHEAMLRVGVDGVYPLCPPYRLSYTLFQPTKRKADISNPLSVIDKFTCDALTSIGFWEDDNYNFVKEVVYKWGGVDRENPRCELVITTIGD